MTLSETEAIRLALLERSSSSRQRRAGWSSSSRTPCRPPASRPSTRSTACSTTRSLADLERDGPAFGHWASNDVDEHGRPRTGAEQLWTITDAGAAELDALRNRTEDD